MPLRPCPFPCIRRRLRPVPCSTLEDPVVRGPDAERRHPRPVPTGRLKRGGPGVEKRMRLRMLGGLELEGSDLTRPVVLLLLAYLALEGPQERRFLAKLLWMDAADPLNRLSSTLTKVRKVAPGAVEGDALRVWADLKTDVDEFLVALDEGQPERAIELYRGPFLLGIQPGAGVEFEEWLYETREGLADRARRAHLMLAGREAGRGRYAAAARHAEAALDVAGASEPEPEDLERVLALLTAAESPRCAAVRREAE